MRWVRSVHVETLLVVDVADVFMSVHRAHTTGGPWGAVHLAARVGGAVLFAFFVFLLTLVFVRPALMGDTRWMDPLELSGIVATMFIATGLMLANWRPRLGGVLVVAASIWPLSITIMRGMNPWVYLTVVLIGTLHLASASVATEADEPQVTVDDA